MIYSEQVKVNKEDFIKFQGMLDAEERKYTEDEIGIHKTYTTSFDDGNFAEVRVWVGQRIVFTEALLFSQEGYEIDSEGAGYNLLGRYRFNHDGNIYIIELVL